MDVLFYVNQIYQDEVAGQNSFETGVMDALQRKTLKSDGQRAVFFTARRPDKAADSSSQSNCIELPLNKQSYFGYLTHQWLLFLSLCQQRRKYRQDKVAVYVRYNAAMVAPVVAALLFQWRLVFRTGPVLQNLREHGKTDNRIVIRGIQWMLGLHCRVASRIIVATRRIGEWVAETYPFAKEKLMVVSNGVDPTRFAPQPPCRARWGIDEDAFVLGYTGTFAELQGVGTVLSAMGQLKASGDPLPYLLLVGDGAEASRWKRRARALGIEAQVIFAGRRPMEEIPAAICSCDVMLLPLHRCTLSVRGTSAMKLFEYLACDRFVLGSQCDDLEFLPRNGVGKLVEPEDVAAWAAAIREEMQRTRRDLAGTARRLTLREYTFDAVADRIWSACFDTQTTQQRSTTVLQAKRRNSRLRESVAS